MNVRKESPETQADVVRLLRCRDTNQYYTGEGWTDNPAKGQPFPNDSEAVRACVSHKLYHVDLVLRLPGPGAEMCITPLN